MTPPANAKHQSPFWPVNVPTDLSPLPRTLCEALRLSAERRPNDTALIFYGTEISFAELLARVHRLSAYLQHHSGVRAGDRVLLDMQNSPHFITAYLAIAHAGAVIVPVNPMNTAAELAYLCQDSGAHTALIGAELLERFSGLVPAPLHHVIVAAYSEEVPEPASLPLPPVMSESVLPDLLPEGFLPWSKALSETRPPLPDTAASNDLCLLIYTSGTTGKPKACMHTHASTLFTAAAQAMWYGLNETSVVTGFMPLFHGAGMQLSLNGCVMAGATTVLMTRWDRELVAPLFKRYGVTVWSAAPTMVVDVLSAPGFDATMFETLRIITGGGAAMPAAVATQLEKRWGLRFVEGYGLTETISATHINPVDRPKAQCLGIPIHETVARIIDPDTLQELPQGTTGEIIIAGPQVMQGYWNRPDANAETFLNRDGVRFLRTGDLGWVDDDGYFHLVDRLKRMINVSGFKVWPAECELILHQHPAVRECCVVGVQDAYRGETVKAYVVRHDSATLHSDELIGWARGVMAAYKVPRLVEFANHLPRSSTNKVDWRQLQSVNVPRATS